MKRLILLSLFVFFYQILFAASFPIGDPTNNSWIKYAGYIDNVEMEVTPQGNYTNIECTFSIMVDSVNYYRDNYYYYGYYSLPTYRNSLLEAQISFDLPENAYIYDSYLWLNQNTIIHADIIERGAATQIYEGIVQRKRDPSLLVKNTATNYSLSVFPMSTAYPRKIKISYAVPSINYQGNNEMVSLPIGILKYVRDNSIIKIKANNAFNHSFNSVLFPVKYNLVSHNMSTANVEILSTDIKNRSEAFLVFSRAQSSVFDFYYNPKNSTEGVYELRIKTAQLPDVLNNTRLFNIKLPFQSVGILFDRYNVSKNRLLTNDQYYEAGMYNGQLKLNDSIRLEYMSTNGIKTYSEAIPSGIMLNQVLQNWTNLFCSNNANTTDAKNLSLTNRVLCLSTAFLALETGDTVKEPKTSFMSNGSGSGGSILALNELSKEGISISPNPFVDYFELTAEEEIMSISILSMDGKVVFLKEITDNVTTVKIIESDINSPLSSGIYYVVVKTKTGLKVAKLLKS